MNLKIILKLFSIYRMNDANRADHNQHQRESVDKAEDGDVVAAHVWWLFIPFDAASDAFQWIKRPAKDGQHRPENANDRAKRKNDEIHSSRYFDVQMRWTDTHKSKIEKDNQIFLG